MAKIQQLAICMALVGLCVIAVTSARRHHHERRDGSWEKCRTTCAKNYPREEQACWRNKKYGFLFNTSLPCAACRGGEFCHFNKCKPDSSDRCPQSKRPKPMETPDDTTEKPEHPTEGGHHEGDEKHQREPKDSICSESPCEADVKPSEHICAKVKAKNGKGKATVVTLRSRKCMEWSNKCEPEPYFHFYELCHEGDCEEYADDSLDQCT